MESSFESLRFGLLTSLLDEGAVAGFVRALAGEK